MTTKNEISQWFDAGVAKLATHMLVVCDTFDYDDYPVYTTGHDQTVKKYEEYRAKSMQKVMEVYDLHGNKSEQLREHRVFRLPVAAVQPSCF